MTRTLVVLALLATFLPSAVFAREVTRVYPKSRRIKNKLSYAKIGGKFVRHGKQWTFYDLPLTPKGKPPVAMVVAYEKGVPHGIYAKYYPNGFIQESGQYVNSVKMGKWRTFYKSGAPKMECTLNKNGLTGVKVIFSPTGKKVSEVTYKDNQRHGSFKTWYADGAPKAVATYEADKLNGLLATWYPTGKQQSQCRYVGGVKDGVEKQWTEKGLPKFERTYVNGKEQGLVKLWAENGKLASEKTYVDGKLDGVCKEYHPTGKVSREAIYKNGLLHGVEVFRLDEGTKRSETTYHFGKRHGKVRVYYPNGKLRSEVTEDRGEAHGPATYWSSTGKLIGKGDFKRGLPRSGTFVIEASPDFKDYFVVNYKDGVQQDFVFYRNGKLAEGEVVETFPYSQTISRRCHYKKGKLNGPDERFFQSGETAYKVNWSNNQPDGLVQRWHNNGKKMWEVQFEQGKKNGYEKAWDIRGRKLCEGQHRNGKPWDGTILVNDPKLSQDVIRAFKNGQPVKDLPTNLQIKINKLPDMIIVKPSKGNSTSKSETGP